MEDWGPHGISIDSPLTVMEAISKFETPRMSRSGQETRLERERVYFRNRMYIHRTEYGAYLERLKGYSERNDEERSFEVCSCKYLESIRRKCMLYYTYISTSEMIGPITYEDGHRILG